jgi:spore coat polysaccharide biosynthesis protein SpsF
MSSKDIHFVIQSRNGSKRLPNKAIKKIGKKTVLDILIDRLKNSKHNPRIIIATTNKPIDDSIIKICQKNFVDHYRGHENDVLKRLTCCIKKFKSKIVVHLTADNFLIDVSLVDWMIDKFLKSKNRFLTNNNFMSMTSQRIPLGMHVSIFKKRDLILVEQKAIKKEFREHPTLFFYTEGKKIFKPKNIKPLKKWIRDYNPRITLDDHRDYMFLKKINNHFLKKQNPNFSLVDILSFLDKNRELMKINSKVNQHIPKILKNEKN